MFPRDIVRLEPFNFQQDGQWEQVRLIRNACAEFMTGRTTPIEWSEQERFREQLNRETDRVYFLRGVTPEDALGFMYLRCRGGSCVPTYGVHPEKRGRGHGEFLVRYSQLLVPHITLSVRRDNRPAINLYTKCGFRVVDDDFMPLDMVWSA